MSAGNVTEMSGNDDYRWAFGGAPYALDAARGENLTREFDDCLRTGMAASIRRAGGTPGIRTGPVSETVPVADRREPLRAAPERAFRSGRRRSLALIDDLEAFPKQGDGGQARCESCCPLTSACGAAPSPAFGRRVSSWPRGTHSVDNHSTILPG